MPTEWEQLIDSGQYVTVDGTDVHYYDEGSGDAIVLLHGGGLTSCAELNWGAVIGLLSESCRVIALDQPGFGFTAPRDERDYMPRKRADFIASFLRKLNIDTATVAGNSRAGYQAVYLGLEYPDLVEKLVVVNAGSASRKLVKGEVPGNLESDEPTLEGAREFLEDFEENHLVRPDNHPLFQVGITEEAIERVYEIQKRNWKFTNARSRNIQTSAESLNEALSYNGTHITEAASNVKQPVLITWGTKPYEGWPRQADEPADNPDKKLVEIHPETLPAYERDEGFDMGVRLFEQLPNSEIHIWHDTKHHVMTDKAARWSDVVADFVTAETNI
ncbi:alpha/beta fold hydrolase [Natronosalvus rutilus]|uniref:Alpha/beta hydrolase n=1 Tax=Natronosalvus rutilus TaxID=2953753 RepID=A0A9E7SWN8_9EURY|nr:alpha/beta hydrolase [Natronosalvus rutilus]UTF55675.1 alpha/beta hydrolase [Natronosalvus rutilus]